MKFGFYGNANNYPMILARALRRLGQEVLFIVDRPELALNRPETRWEDMNPLPEWVVDLGAFDPWMYPSSPVEDQAVRLLDGCDVVVLNERAMCLAPRLAKPWIAFVTGADVIRHADPRDVQRSIWPEYTMRSWRDWLHPRRLRGHLTLQHFYRDRVNRQRQALAGATLVHCFAPGLVPEVDDVLASLGVQDDRRVWLVMTDTENLRPLPPARNAIPRIFCVARLNWTAATRRRLGSDLGMKGTDILLEGVARLGTRRVSLRLPRKGLDVAETVELVDQLGLRGVVEWVDEMTQAEVFEEYRRADIVTDSLSRGIVGMGGLDALACGRPVVGNARPEILGPLGLTWTAVTQAADSEGVAAALESLLGNSHAIEEASRNARAFAESRLAPERSALKVLELLGKKGVR